MSDEHYKTLKISEFYLPESLQRSELNGLLIECELEDGRKITRLNPDVNKCVMPDITVVVEAKTGFIVPSIFKYLMSVRTSGVEDVAFDARALRLYFDFLKVKGLRWDEGDQEEYRRPVNRFSEYLTSIYRDGFIAAKTAIGYFNAVMRFYKHHLSLAYKFRYSVPVEFNRKVIKKYDHDLTSHITGLEIVVDVAKCRPRISTNDRRRELRPILGEQGRVFRGALRQHASYELKLICVLAITTGLRADEIADLRADMLDGYANEKVWELMLGPSVGHSTKLDSDLPVIVSGSIMGTLISYNKSLRYLKRSKKKEHTRVNVFLTQSGKPYDQKTISTLFGDFVKKHVHPILPSFSHKFHDLRATFGVTTMKSCLDKGVAPSDAIAFTKAQMRHKQIKDTLHYLEYFNQSVAVEAQADANEELLRDVLESEYGDLV